MIDFQLLASLKNELEKNQIIRKVYSVEDNKKDFIHQITAFTSFTTNDFLHIYNSLLVNIGFLKEYVSSDRTTSKNIQRINSLIFDLSDDNVEENEEFISSLNDDNKSILISLQNMIVLYAVTSFEEKEIGSFLSFGENNEDDYTLLYSSKGKYYRGEGDFSYKLLPSIFRNYNVSKYGPVCDIATLFSLYRDSNLLSKYKEIFDYRYVDYDFCAYMQHSKAYSPLLDLTSNPSIALSFATKSSGDMNKYMNSDASLYEFSFTTFKELNVDDVYLFRNHNTFIIDGRLRISSFVRNKILCKCTYLDFAIDVSIFDKKVNDRMKYQKGAFLYINNSVVVNGIMLMPLSMGKITKYRIPTNNKITIYNANKKYRPQYDYEHLMDPYMFFNDAPNK